MKKFIFLLIFFSISLFANENINQKNKQNNEIELKNEQINFLNKENNELKSKSEYQEKLNEQTLNSISIQLSATSYNLTFFGILFTIIAIGIGFYVTYIERKIVTIREENKALLVQTISTKDEVVEINELIQKDIFGLFLKIKREETIDILKRLLKIPKDISNFSNQLLSRELEKDDYYLLKEAYNIIKNEPKENDNIFEMDYSEGYKLLFFQHFLDLAVKDITINKDLLDYYGSAINCAFENDIIKSTEDFMKGILDSGFQSKTDDIVSFFRGISDSKFKNFDKIYEITFNVLKNRDDQFKFFEIISNDIKSRIAKLNFGKLLISSYSNTELSQSEKNAIERTNEIQKIIEKEEKEEKEAIIEQEKIKKLEDDRIKLLEEEINNMEE